MKASIKNIILSCEHGGNQVPGQYRRLFQNNSAVLNTHRAWDKGALVLAKSMEESLAVPLVYTEITRLLVDLNRSLHHHQLFSEFSRQCNKQTKNNLLNEIYFPYRRQIECDIQTMLNKNKPVLHFSIHSFIPKLEGQIRNADIGLLYDPERMKERLLCKKLQAQVKLLAPALKIRRNYPYRGNADGLTTHLRHLFNTEKYIGIEIEINQRHIKPDNNRWLWLRQPLIDAIYMVLVNGYKSVGQ